MKYMLDTNVLIHAIKHKPESVLKRLTALDPEDVCISAITYAELRHGVEKSAARERNGLALDLMLVRIDIAPFTSETAERYGEVRAALEHSGTPIGPLDTLIAAHALSLGLMLVTSNVREFSRVEGLSVEDWTTV